MQLCKIILNAKLSLLVKQNYDSDSLKINRMGKIYSINKNEVHLFNTLELNYDIKKFKMYALFITHFCFS